MIGAVKRAVDSERRAGRFILTGSVRADTEARAGAHPLTVREQLARPGHPFLDRLLAGRDPPDLRGYANSPCAAVPRTGELVGRVDAGSPDTSSN